VDFVDYCFLWVSTALDAVAAVAVLLVLERRSRRRGRNPSIRLNHLFTAAAAAVGVFLLKLPVHAVRGLGVSGPVYLGLLFLAITLPALGVAALMTGGWRRMGGRRRAISPPATVLAILFLAAVPVAAWASFVEPFRLQIETAAVPVLPPRTADPIRAGVLADLQTSRVTAYERRAVDELLALHPDLILMPGDLFQGTDAEFERELPALRQLHARLEAPFGVYAVAGNVDFPYRLHAVFAGTAVRLLVNEIVEVEVRGCRLAIGGIEWEFSHPAARATIARLSGDRIQADVRVLLTHAPDPVLDLPPTSRIDLLVAGHTHGGQVRIPGIGPVFTGSRVPQAMAAGGLTRTDGPLVYVSRGVGCERGRAPRLRLFCPPEISLLTFVPKR
jgi:predicted MPP superfamily phosphohydrolase